MFTSIGVDRLLLLAGIAAGVLFFIVPSVEIFRRPGFDIERHAISMLSLGSGGWRMKTVFFVSGLLTLLCALGVHRAATGWPAFVGALLIGAFGVGLILAGLFDAPAGLGFPQGTPHDQAPTMTPGAVVHSIAFMVAFSGLIASCFAFTPHFLFAQQPVWAGVSAAVGMALPTLIALGMSSTMAPGVAFYWAAMLGWLWLGVTVTKLLPVA